jgi:hypothetical protein
VLQYAYDTIICLEHDLTKARNMKLLLYMFEQMFGLKNNFEKSEVVLVERDDIIVVSYANISNCQIGSFPLKYLGVPLSANMLHMANWFRLEKKLDIWKGNSLSSGGRTILINSSLSSTAVHHMSMFLMPKTAIHRMDKVRRRFFWQGGFIKRKYHLVKWDKICKSKKQGGLAIKDLR